MHGWLKMDQRPLRWGRRSFLVSNPALARYVRHIWQESLGRIIKSESHYYVKRKSEFLFFGSNWLYRQVVDQSADNGERDGVSINGRI